jgi:hypothetical protein
VEAFDLPGLGDGDTPAREVTLDGCATRLCEVLATTPNRRLESATVWVALSRHRGAARCPERVAPLVDVSAFSPKDGQSLFDLDARDTHRQKHTEPDCGRVISVNQKLATRRKVSHLSSKSL